MTETLLDLIKHLNEMIVMCEKDLDKTADEDMASYYQGQLEAYGDCLAKLNYIMG